MFKILRKDDDIVAIDKPNGFHVHQPESPRYRVDRAITCLANLRDQIGAYVYPVHRLDAGTEGVLIFALKKEIAGDLCRQFMKGQVKKRYFAIVRGWAPDNGIVDVPLALDSTGEMVAALTLYSTHSRTELPFAVGKRHASARYSLVEARPETGRFHQIRRHLARLSHPIVGDRYHGDSHHNRFFREKLNLGGLWLKSKSIEFKHPGTGQPQRIESDWTERWLGAFAQLGLTESDPSLAQTVVKTKGAE